MVRKITSDEALALASELRLAAVALGNYRFSHWRELRPAQRKRIEDREWSLLSLSSDCVTLCVGLAVDETRASLARIRGIAGDARESLETLDALRDVLKVATGFVGLAAALISGNWETVAARAESLLGTCRRAAARAADPPEPGAPLAQPA